MLLVPVFAALGLDAGDKQLGEQLVGALDAHAPLSGGVGPLRVQAENPEERRTFAHGSATVLCCK